MNRKTKRTRSARTHFVRGVCGGCSRRAQLGTCDWGKPHVDTGVHCRACCSRPDLDGWRPLRRPAEKKER